VTDPASVTVTGDGPIYQLHLGDLWIGELAHGPDGWQAAGPCATVPIDYATHIHPDPGTAITELLAGTA
jgi:hypothetical protein